MFDLFHSYIPNPIIFQIGHLSIHWYGIFLFVAVLIGYWIINKFAHTQNISKQVLTSIYINSLIFGFVSARAYHVLSDWSYYSQNPSQIIAVWNGGLAIHGAIIGSVLYIYYFTRKNNINFWKIADLFVIPGILGQSIGRWGNYFNQELFGIPTNSWYGIPIDLAHRPVAYAQNIFFHPVFLYESILDLIVFGVLLFIFKKQKITDGFVFWLYLGLYSCIRIFTEQIKVNQAAIIFGMRLPLAISILFAIISIIMLSRLIFKSNYKIMSL